MSYFVLPILLFSIKLRMNYLGWGRESCFFCYRFLLVLLFLFEGVSSSSGCLVYAALIYFWHSLSLQYNYFASDTTVATNVSHIKSVAECSIIHPTSFYFAYCSCVILYVFSYTATNTEIEPQ